MSQEILQEKVQVSSTCSLGESEFRICFIIWIENEHTKDRMGFRNFAYRVQSLKGFDNSDHALQQLPLKLLLWIPQARSLWSKSYYGIFQPAHPCLLSSHNTRTNFPTCPVYEVPLGCLTFLGKPNQPRTSPSGSGDCGNLGSREAVGSSPHPLSVQHKGHSLANFFSY